MPELKETVDKSAEVPSDARLGSAAAATKMSLEVNSDNTAALAHPTANIAETAGANAPGDAKNNSSSQTGKDVPVSATIESDGSFSFAAAGQENSPIKLTDFNQAATDVIKAVDPSGRVTEGELAKAMENQQFKGQDAQVLAALYYNYGELSKLTQTPDEQNKGLSGDDVARLPLAAMFDAGKMDSWANSNFGKFASNGSLSQTAIEAALAKPSTSSQDATALRLLEQYFPQISQGQSSSSSNADAISLADVDNFRKNTMGNQERGALYLSMTSDLARTSVLGEGADVNHQLYSSSNPLDSIKPEAVTQGFIDDCFFDSPLAALAQRNPSLIANAIKDNNNGTYTVTFPGAPNEPITVTPPTEAELGLYDGGSKYGTWAPIMEKAFGEYRRAHAQQFQISDDPDATPEKGADGMGIAQDAMTLLTGKQAAFVGIHHEQSNQKAQSSGAPGSGDSSSQSVQTNPAAIGQLLDEVINKDNLPITAAVYGDNTGHTKNGALIDQHEYTVLGYTPDGKGSGTVTLRNPYGGAKADLQMSLDDFSKGFDGITFSAK